MRAVKSSLLLQGKKQSLVKVTTFKLQIKDGEFVTQAQYANVITDWYQLSCCMAHNLKIKPLNTHLTRITAETYEEVNKGCWQNFDNWN